MVPGPQLLMPNPLLFRYLYADERKTQLYNSPEVQLSTASFIDELTLPKIRLKREREEELKVLDEETITTTTTL